MLINLPTPRKKTHITRNVDSNRGAILLSDKNITADPGRRHQQQVTYNRILRCNDGKIFKNFEIIFKILVIITCNMMIIMI
jgi:hypothetical protein